MHILVLIELFALCFVYSLSFFTSCMISIINKTYYSQGQDMCGYDGEPVYESRKLSRHLKRVYQSLSGYQV